MRRMLVFVALFYPAFIAAGQNVSTQHNDNARTGQNTNETILTPSNVNSTSFGKLLSLSVDGYVYAQPLYIANVPIAGGTHNVVYVATEGDSVYAFDADSGTPLWHVSLIDAAHGAGTGETTVNIQNTLSSGCTDLVPQVGITSTPVIDPSGRTMYVEAKSMTTGPGYLHRLHTLDITTGAEKSPGPRWITATVPGTSDGGTSITFDALHQLNRPGLLLSNGMVYLAYGSHCDLTRYHGWIFAYNASTLVQTAVFITTPNGQGQGALWMSGAGLAADSTGNIFAATGNGNYDATDVGDSIVKLNGSTLSLLDYFTAFDQSFLDSQDRDLGSGGVLLLPVQSGAHPDELVEAGKGGAQGGTIYLVDRDQMTTNNVHFCSANCNNTDPEIVQEIQHAGNAPWLFAMPAYWNNTVYFWGVNDVLKAYSLTNGLLSGTPTSSSVTSLGFPGATPSISANGNTNGIVWAIDSSHYGSPGPGPGPAVLHAYDASNVANELWNSSQASNNRDTAGNAVKFTVPTIANGKVYIGSQTEVDVYGLLTSSSPGTTATPLITPGSESVTSSVQVTITDGTSNAMIFYTTDGSTPSAASPTHGTQYTGSFTVTSTTTVKAAAIATGQTQSAIAMVTYTIQPNSGSSINYSSGMTSTGLILSGSAIITNSRLRLTDTGTNEAGSAFFTTAVNVQTFSTDFLFQLTSPNADGFTFAIHGGSTPAALGPSGGGLGYGPSTPSGTPGVPNSIAVKFDLYNNNGEGNDSTGLYINGASPTTPFVDMTNTGINLHSGDIFHVHISYDGTTLAITITDTSTQTTFSNTWQVNIPSTVGGPTAYLGFTGGTGGLTAIQEIINWTYASGASTGTGTTITRINTASAANTSGTKVTQISAAPLSQTAGNLLVVACKHGTDTTTTMSVADSANDTFSALPMAGQPGVGAMQLFYAKNIQGSASNVVTCSFSANVSYVAVDVVQYAGLDTSSPLDTHAETFSNSANNTCTSGSFSTAAANEVVLATCTPAATQRSFTAGSGYTVEVNDPAGQVSLEDQIVSTTQTNATATETFNGTFTWIMLAVTFKVVPASAPPAAPANLVAVAGNAQVQLSWTASSGATSYNVKRSTNNGGPYTTAASPTATSYTDTGLSNGTTYYYVVTAVNTQGESGTSNQVSATPATVATITKLSVATGTNASGTKVTQISAAPLSQTAGNLLVVACKHGTDTTTTMSVADSANDTYAALPMAGQPGVGAMQFFYAKNIQGSASNVVTCSFSANVSYVAVDVVQYAGLDTSSPLDTHAETFSNSANNTCTSGSFSTAAANEVVLAACTPAATQRSFTAGSGYTVEVNDPAGQVSLEDQIVSTTQTNATATETFNGTFTWIMLAVTFKTP